MEKYLTSAKSVILKIRLTQQPISLEEVLQQMRFSSHQIQTIQFHLLQTAESTLPSDQFQQRKVQVPYQTSIPINANLESRNLSPLNLLLLSTAKSVADLQQLPTLNAKNPLTPEAAFTVSIRDFILLGHQSVSKESTKMASLCMLQRCLEAILRCLLVESSTRTIMVRKRSRNRRMMMVKYLRLSTFRMTEFKKK